jgi:hypothetical protein
MPRYLVVPGLLGPAPAPLTVPDLPGLPHLERLLRDAEALPGLTGYATQVCELFGLRASVDADLPLGAIGLAHASGERPDGWVMQADPVTLRPDRDQLLLFAGDSLAVDADESAQFVDAFNRHFAADGLRLVAPSAAHWFLLSEHAPDIVTSPLDAVIGRNIDGFLPQGPGTRFWRGIANEVQMLFHDLAPNRRREAEGRLPVSGLWFSGVGRMPAIGRSPFGSVDSAGDPLIEALVQLAPSAGDDTLQAELGPWRALLAADAGAWIDALQQLDRRLPALVDDSDGLLLLPCDGRRFAARRGRRWHFWRRSRPFADWLARPDAATAGG